VPIGLVERILVPNSAWFDLGPTFATLRRAKDPDEVACIERSLRAMEQATATLRRELAPGKTELDAFTNCQRAAAESLQAPAAIYGDFVAGPTIDRRGGPPSTRAIQAGELFLLDFSVVVQGYRGDFATTWAVGGDPSAEALRLHEICLDALDAGEAVLKPGVKGREVDAAVRAVMQREGLEANSPSHTGHGLGLGHPEAPYLVRDSEDVLVAGDIVTLEPSLFVAGVAGMRIEHNYRITPEGFERLSQHDISLTA
jgi:Xaa-Pro aminopeptidase